MSNRREFLTLLGGCGRGVAVGGACATEGARSVVTRLDRLARSTRDLLNMPDQIGKRAAGFKSILGPIPQPLMPDGC
jgi:hypothetical protein